MQRTTTTQVLLDKLVTLAGDAARERTLRFEAEDRLHKATNFSVSTESMNAAAVMLMQCLAERRYIEAIKAYRMLSGLPLKEAKDAVDRITSQLRPPTSDAA